MLTLLAAACAGAESASEETAETATEEQTAVTEAPTADDQTREAEGEVTEEAQSAEEVEPFYAEGARVDLVVPTSPGGGTDTMARLVAPYLGEELGVDIQVTNIPGGGTVLGTNEYVNQIEPDGHTLLMSSSSGHMAVAVNQVGVEFSLSDIAPIAAFPVSGVIYSHADGPFQEPEDLAGPNQPQPVLFASQPPGGASLKVLLPFEMLETELNTVFGYAGSGDARLAFQRGESDVRFDTSPSYFSDIEPLVEDGEVIPLIQFGRVENGEVVPSEEFPDLPTPVEVYEDVFGEEASGPALEAYKVSSIATITLSKALGIHADAPPEAREEVLAAMEAVVADEEFREDAAALGSYEFLVGPEAEDAWGDLASIDAESDVMQWLLQWLEDTYDVQLDAPAQ